MSLTVPALYHWSPAANRPSIIRGGLRPMCPTAVWVRPFRPSTRPRHRSADLPDDVVATVCLGTSPSSAWALSGRISAVRGSTWDLYEVEVDEVHFVPSFGGDLWEVRVANRIPKSRCWLVASRVVPMHGRR